MKQLEIINGELYVVERTSLENLIFEAFPSNLYIQSVLVHGNTVWVQLLHGAKIESIDNVRKYGLKNIQVSEGYLTLIFDLNTLIKAL